MSASTPEEERFDTLISPCGTVATLNRLAELHGVEAAGFDAAFPDSETVKQAIRSEIENTLMRGEQPFLLFTLLVYNAEASLRFLEDLKKTFGQYVTTVVGGQLVPFAQAAYLHHPSIDVTCVGDGEILISTLIRDFKCGTLKDTYSLWLSDCSGSAF